MTPPPRQKTAVVTASSSLGPIQTEVQISQYPQWSKQYRPPIPTEVVRARQKQEYERMHSVPSPPPPQVQQQAQAPMAPKEVSAITRPLGPDPRAATLSPVEFSAYQQFMGSVETEKKRAIKEYGGVYTRHGGGYSLEPATYFTLPFSAKQSIREWELSQRDIFFKSILGEYRRGSAQQRYNYAYTSQQYSKKFYETIGFPEFGGKHQPFSIPKDYKVTGITKTPEGLNVTLQSTIIPELPPNAQVALEMQRKFGPMFSFGRAVYQAVRPDIQTISGVARQTPRPQTFTYKPYKPRMGREPEIYAIPKAVKPSYHPTFAREPETFGVARSEMSRIPFSITMPKPKVITVAAPKGLAQQILDFSPARFAAGILGIEDEQRIATAENMMKQEQIGSTIFPSSKKAQTLLGEYVTSFESPAYIPFQLAGVRTPTTPQSFSGAVVAEAGAKISGVGGGDTQRFYEQYGVSGIGGSILGDITVSYLIGKGIGWARATRVGGKILNPILKPLDIAEDYLKTKVYDPIKGKAITFKHKISPPKPKLTGFERGAFGAEGYSITEYYGPPEKSIFESPLPSIIRDETGDIFVPQTARATSYPVKVTSSEQIVYGIGGKPWIAIIKNPPNLIGGGRMVLSDPSLFTKNPSPVISSLKTKVASQLMGAFAGPSESKFLVSALTGLGLGTITLETPKPAFIHKPKFTPLQVYTETEKEKEIFGVNIHNLSAFKLLPAFNLSLETQQINSQLQSTQATQIVNTMLKQVEDQIAIPTTLPKFKSIVWSPQKVGDLTIPLVGQMQDLNLQTLQEQLPVQIQIPTFEMPQRQEPKHDRPMPFPMPTFPKGWGKTFIPYFKRRKHKGKGDSALFGGWGLKEHPIPTVEQISKNIVGIPLKTGQTQKTKKAKLSFKTPNRKKIIGV